MKNYKDYLLIYLGRSDMASLVLVYFDNVDYEVQSKILPMGSDGAYREGLYTMMWRFLVTTPNSFQSMQVG